MAWLDQVALLSASRYSATGAFWRNAGGIARGGS